MKRFLCISVIAVLLAAPSAAIDCTKNSCSSPEMHTMCRYPDPQPAAACGKVVITGFTEAEKDEIVQTHNKLRKYVAAGKETRGSPGPQPAAKYMKTLTWDDELAEIAQRWVSQCKLHKDTCRNVDRFYVSQNAAASWISGDTSKRHNALINMWYNGVVYMNRSNVHKYKSQANSSAYTNIVWARTKKIGCGQIVYQDRVWHKYWMVCNYGPGGNHEGRSIYKISDNTQNVCISRGLHSLYLYPNLKPAAACGKVRSEGLTQTEKDEIVKTHNRLRQIVASGKETRGNPGPQPAAMYMRTLTWDDDIAEIAQRWANQCHYDEDMCLDDDRFILSQNIGRGMNTETLTTNVSDIIVNQWYDTVTDMDRNSVHKYKYSVSTSAYAHIVWAKTRKIGCGKIVFRKDGSNIYHLVCNYGPGSTEGQPIYKTVDSTDKLCASEGKHTLYLFPNPQPAAACGNVTSTGLTQAEKDEIVNTHNRLREFVAAGNETRGNPGPQPAATNMKTMSWDDEIAEIAQRWANQCQFDYDVCRNVERFNVGQNIARAMSFGPLTAKPSDMIVHLWYNEVKNMEENNVYDYKLVANPETKCYTQIVWANTEKVGCGKILYQNSGWNISYLVCNYGSGMYEGQPIYQTKNIIDKGHPPEEWKPAAACGNVMKTGFTQAEKDEIVNTHNTLREFVAAGNETRGNPGPQPAAKYMKTLTWDDELAEMAQRWANQCQSGHDDSINVERFPVGQNTGAVESNETLTTKPSDIIINSWYNQVNNMDRNNIYKYKFAANTSDYTKIVKDNTEKVGCGQILYEKDERNIYYLVCNYGPGGNVIDAPIYETRKCTFSAEHTLQLYPNPEPAAACGEFLSVGLTQTEKDEIVKTHNRLRQIVASGKEKRGDPGPQPAATNMKTLTWDDEIAEIAQRWTNQCQFGHDACRSVDRFYVGQNVGIAVYNKNHTNKHSRLIHTMYRKVQYMDRNIVNKYQYVKITAAYTQIVWAKTEKVGCGKIVFQVDTGYKYLLVCNYGPGGNRDGQPIYKTNEIINKVCISLGKNIFHLQGV